MKAILHIGLQKTGTSSIQVMLASSNSNLESIGYTFPPLPQSEESKSSVWTSPFRHNCVAGSYADFNSVFEKMNIDESKLFWTDILEGDLIPILSAEEFSRQNDFSLIAKAMDGFDVEVVVYLRRQDKYIESLYNQRNKILTQREDISCLTEHFLAETDLFHFIKASGYKKMLNYTDMLHRIQTQLRPANIIIRNFNRDEMIGQDVCVDFCSAIGVDAQLMSHPERDANQSISNDVLREWKAIFDDQGGDAAKNFIHQVNVDIENGANYSGDYLILSEKTRARILDEYKSINQTIEDSFGVRVV